jgi:hypothetical protein
MCVSLPETEFATVVPLDGIEELLKLLSNRDVTTHSP